MAQLLKQQQQQERFHLQLMQHQQQLRQLQLAGLQQQGSSCRSRRCSSSRAHNRLRAALAQPGRHA
jgi:hypothetical protein